VNDRRPYSPYKIKSVTDTPPERVAHSLQRTPARQSPTPLGPGRNDLFHARVPAGFVAEVFRVIADTPQHTYQVLTKRSSRLKKIAGRFDWPPNLWMGVSVEDSRALYRVDDLRTVPAAVRFLSCEPLLGPLDDLRLDGIGWVIAGGESGPGHRPLDVSWVAGIRDNCVGAGVPFFFKQWGGRTPKEGGRELDGRRWDQMPALAAV
jgi:protein gp37